MGEYYAVERSEAYLVHYGVKGMRWKVRKAIKKGDKEKYYNQYRKASKKLKKLEKQANRGMKYTQKAITSGFKAAAAAGPMIAGIANPSIFAYKAGKASYNAYRATTTKSAAEKAQKWRDEMDKEFNFSALEEVRASKKRRGRKRHS